MDLITFVSILGSVISAEYTLSANSNVVVVNAVNSRPLGAPVTPIAAGGSGTLTIRVPPEVRPGKYYLKAQDQSGGYLAQSVYFYIAKP